VEIETGMLSCSRMTTREGPHPGASVIASALSVSLRFRPETKRLKFLPRSRFLLQFRSLVMF
jgi:hypothetical protein